MPQNTLIVKIASKLGSQFLTYGLSNVKNSKVLRDFKNKMIKDNYSKKVKEMFKASIDDAKSVIELPDELITELLEDKINREEMFRWILEDISLEKFNKDNLSLQPYFERCSSRHQDNIIPFFKLILSYIYEYKIANWDPEFLQILSRIRTLETKLDKGFDKIEDHHKEHKQMLEKNNSILKSITSPIKIDDLDDLINQGKVLTARERANERLKNKEMLSQKERLNLNATIATTYFMNGEEKESIKYLHSAIIDCEDLGRQKRLESLLNIFEEKFDRALIAIKEAIDFEGYSRNNLEILINIHLRNSKYNEILEIIDEHQEENLDFLKSKALFGLKDYNKVLDMAEENLIHQADNLDWILTKAEASILKLEEELTDGNIENISDVFNDIIPLLNSVNEDEIENLEIKLRIKELKGALYFRNNDFHQAISCYRYIYNRKKNYISFKNLIESCICAEEFDIAINILTNKLNDDQIDLDNVIILAELYLSSDDPIKSKNILDNYKYLLEEQGINQFFLKYYLLYINVLFKSLEYSEIESVIKELEDKEINEADINVLKGYYSFLTHDWNQVIKYLEPHLNNLVDEIELKCKLYLSRAYLNTDKVNNFIKLKEVILSINNWKQNEILVNSYVKSLYELGEYSTVISLYKSNLSNRSIFLLEVATTIYFNFGWYDLAKENYKTLYQYTDNIEYLLSYANCLFRLGRTEDAFEKLKIVENRVAETGNSKDFHLLSLTYMSVMKYRKSIEYAYKAFSLGKENPDVWRFYLGHFSQLDQFIENPKKEWVEAYCFCQVKFDPFIN